MGRQGRGQALRGQGDAGQPLHRQRGRRHVQHERPWQHVCSWRPRTPRPPKGRTRLRWPPLMPRVMLSPTMVSATSLRPSTLPGVGSSREGGQHNRSAPQTEQGGKWALGCR